MMTDLEKMGRETLGETVRFAVIRDGQTVHTSVGRGVRPLLELLGTSPGLLKGATVADKIVGKAAALLFLKGGVARVYGGVMSDEAYCLLDANGVQAAYGVRADAISNRDGTDLCPMERAVLETDNPDEAFTILKDTVNKLTAKRP